MPPLLYDPPDLRQYTAGSDPPMSAWPGARDNARRPKPKATRKPRPRSWPSAIMTAETGAGPSAWRARRHRGQRPVLGALPDGPGERAPTPAAVPHAPCEDGGQGLQRPPAGPKRGMQGLAEALRGRRPRIGSQWLLTRSLRVLAGSFAAMASPWPAEGLCNR